MTISTRDFFTVVADQVATIQGKATALVDMKIGSVLRAVVEANAGVAVWLQSLVLQVLSMSRASTSIGADLDSWVADYGIARTAAIAATGQVSFSRFTPSFDAVINPGDIVQTADGSQQYTVIADTSNANWDSLQSAYVLASGIQTISVPVQAVTPGSAGNALIGMVNTLASAIPGVDAVSNAASFETGADAETDAALRERFIAFIASLSKATRLAISYAIESVNPNLSYNLVENQTVLGAPLPGFFFIVVDDGTGSPSSSLLSQLSAAVDAVRPLCSTFTIIPPTIIAANVTMTITTTFGYTHSEAVNAVTLAVTDYINRLGVNAPLEYTRLFQVAYDASPGVQNVASVTLNGGTADLASSITSAIRAGTVTIS